MLEGMIARVRSPVLVGRAGPLAALREALSRARAGRSSAVLVGGEAGVGKSRLVSEFGDAARQAGVRVLAGGCLEMGADGLPFMPFTAMLRELVRDLGAEGVASLLPGGAAREFARLLPEFGEPDQEPDPGVARARLFEQILVLAERLSGDGPLLLVVEDAHWAGRSTRDLLAFLAGSLPILDGVLVVVTYRSDELHRTHPLRPLLAELGRLAWVERMELPPLDRLAADELVARILGREPEPALADAVYQRAGGNPLFIEELLGCDGLTCLPESLRDLVLAAVRRLPDDTQEVLRAASAGGVQVGHGLLAAVTGMAEQDLARALRPAVAANVLAAGTEGYRFRHALIQEAVHDDLLPGERTRLHTRFAQALASDPGLAARGRAVIEQAHHWYQAHDTTWALVSAWQAAAAAGQALAHAEQLTLLARVLELWDLVPDAAGRIGASHLAVLEQAATSAGSVDDPQRGFGFASAALDEVDPAAEPARAARLLETRARLGRHSEQGRPADDLREALRLVPPGTDDATRARVLVSQAKLARDFSPQARAAAEETLELARRANDPATEASALGELALTESQAGHDALALELFEQARAATERAGAYRELLHVAINESHVLEGIGDHERAARVARRGIAAAQGYGLARATGTFLAINVAEPLAALGRWDEATEVIEHALALSPEPRTRAALRMLAGEIALRRGDLTSAREWATAAAAALAPGRVAGRLAGQYHLPLARLEIGLRLAEHGPARAVAAARDAVSRFDLARDPRYAWPLLVCAARACAVARGPGGGRGLAEQAAELAGKLATLAGELGAAGPVQQAGRLTFLALAARPAAAASADDQAAWEAAAAAWERLGQPYELAAALAGVAEAALARGDRDTAGPALRRAAELADSLGARPLRGEIGVLARNGRIGLAGGEHQPSEPARHGLTAREFEVLRLVAAGRSNPEIAAELYISVKTASVHVSNILAKLGAASRGEAAAAAHRLRLFDPVAAG
jgi:DNA-binding CsgD family transcriptional regulator